MTTTAKQRTISTSKLRDLCDCGEYFRRRHIERESCSPTLPMVRGTGAHGGVEENFRQKIATHEDLSASDIADAAVAEFDRRVEEEGVYLGETELDGSMPGGLSVIGDTRDSVVVLAKAHATQVAPFYQPTHVEERFELDVSAANPELDYLLTGRIDVIAVTPERPPSCPSGSGSGLLSSRAGGDCRSSVSSGGSGAVMREGASSTTSDVLGRLAPAFIRDFKFSARRPDQLSVDKSPQLTMYAAASPAIVGHVITDVGIETMVNNKKPARDLKTSTRTKADVQVLVNLINAYDVAMQAGVFVPNPGSFKCSLKHCPYYRTCKYVR